MTPCKCCGDPGVYNILLAIGPGSDWISERLYLPNQDARLVGEVLQEVWFCRRCMRIIEDNFRATVIYLQLEAAAHED